MKDKVVVITGASSGIGKALAMNLARLGANVILAARSYEKLSEVSDQINAKYSGFALPIVTDVTKEKDCENLIGRTISEFGRIDIIS